VLSSASPVGKVAWAQRSKICLVPELDYVHGGVGERDSSGSDDRDRFDARTHAHPTTFIESGLYISGNILECRKQTGRKIGNDIDRVPSR
jgi:hypothetical protein